LANKNNCRQSILETYQVVQGIGYQHHRIVSEYQSSDLLAKMWQTSSAQHYIQNAALLWQKQEGYCGRATLRCVLKSFGCRADELPPEMRGESKPEKFASHLAELAPKRLNITTEIVSGSVDFATFVATLRQVNNHQSNCRIAINYLRSALFGFAFPWFLPVHFILGLFGGHFSPVVGVLEQVDHPDDPLVAVFDVNHKYHGAYLVPASRLYRSVAAVDVTSGQHRAVIVVTSAPL
jgi:Phytochelatin synthase